MSIRRLALLGLCLVVTVGGHPTSAQVSSDRIRTAAEQEPHNWLTYSGGYAGQRYSQLARGRPPATSRHLAVQWIFQTGIEGAVRGDAPGDRRGDVPDHAQQPRLRIDATPAVSSGDTNDRCRKRFRSAAAG